MSKTNKIIIALQIIILPLWFIHIYFATSNEAAEAFRFYLNDNAMDLIKRGIPLIISLIVCSGLAMGVRAFKSFTKEPLNKESQKESGCKKSLSIALILMLNLAFLCAYFYVLGGNLAFYCRYYWAIDCKNNAEYFLCQHFPIEVDFAYLFFILPPTFTLTLIWLFILRNKLLGIESVIYFILLCINAAAIFVQYGESGLGCYD